MRVTAALLISLSLASCDRKHSVESKPSSPAVPLGLWPCESVWSGSSKLSYALALSETLAVQSAYREMPVAKAIVRPAFEPEWAVSVHPSAGGFEVIAVVLDASVWEHRSRAEKLPKKTIARAFVSEDTGQLLASVWTSLMGEARNDSPSRGVDGTSTTFMSFVPDRGGFLCAETWSPEETSLAARLGGISERLRQFALAEESERPERESLIAAEARALLEALRDLRAR